MPTTYFFRQGDMGSSSCNDLHDFPPGLVDVVLIVARLGAGAATERSVGADRRRPAALSECLARQLAQRATVLRPLAQAPEWHAMIDPLLGVQADLPKPRPRSPTRGC